MEWFFNSQQGILGIDGKPKLNAKVTEQVLKNFPDANLMVCYPHTIVTKMKLYIIVRSASRLSAGWVLFKRIYNNLLILNIREIQENSQQHAPLTLSFCFAQTFIETGIYIICVGTPEKIFLFT